MNSRALTSRNQAPVYVADDGRRGDWAMLVSKRLRAHDIPEDVIPDVLDALAEPVDPTSTVTEAERAFALSAGVPEEAFTADADAANRQYELESAASDEADFRRSVLTTEQVAELLGVKTDNVRQQSQRHALYSAGYLNGQKVFPRWQFTADRRSVPGLRDVIPAFPVHYHPLDVQAVMTAPDEALGGRSPKQWLESGGNVDAVVELVSGLSYT